jgi:beta-lactamase superfamily II metal-dependent hydrolase
MTTPYRHPVRRPYNGMEIDMLAVGDADCILVSRWIDGQVTRVLIDGGERKHADYIRDFLRRRGVDQIHHLVSSHLDRDHTAGLIELVKDQSLTFERAWVHRPELNVTGRELNEINEALDASAGNPLSDFLVESLQNQRDLVQALEARRVTIDQPFAGESIGFLEVHGPTRAYYRQLLARFRERERVRLLCEQHEIQAMAEARLPVPDMLRARPITSPENNSSTILACSIGGYDYLFTGDAGADALRRVAGSVVLENVAWMQVPHHGSKHNITEPLIAHFFPKACCVSAGGGEHPDMSVIEAFKDTGADAFGTHWPDEGDLYFSVGTVPRRFGYSRATPL